tara:strand:+ start:20034 stop:22943 length:2910 start_codon:yes stop_codon:yes gene_type:complete
MSNKTIAIKVDLQGTEAQKKKLAALETEVKKLTLRRAELNKTVKKSGVVTKKYGQELAAINTKLKANRRQLLVTRQEMLGIDGFTTRLGKSFRKMGTSIVAGFAGMFAIQKIAQLFSNATKIMKDFEQQMATVQAITGATGKEFASLEKSAKELGATTQFTASEVGKLQEEYAKLGFTTEQILDASEATLELATATGSDLAQSAKVAAATINGFGLEAKDTQKIVDVMAKSFTSSALDLSKFETAMSAVAPVAATVGMSLEETTASLGVLVDAGFDASTAGTALRNILLDTQKAGISTSEAFDMIKKSADPTSTALDLFGKRGAAVAIALAKSTDKTAEFTKELENSRGAAEAMARIVGDTLEGDIKRFNSAWEGLVLNLGENANDLFRGVVEGATDFISTIGDLTKNIHAESDAMQQQGVQVNALANRILKLKEGDEDRLELLNELNILNPEITKGVDLQTISNEQLAKSLKQNNQELIRNIILKREQEELAEQAAEVADIERDRVKDQMKAEELLSQIRLKALKSIELANQRGKDTDVTKTRRAQLAIVEQTNLSFQEQAVALAAVNQASFRSEEVYELLKLSRSTRRLNNDLKDEQDILDEITKRTKKLEERFGKGQEKSSDASKKTTTSLNSQAKAVDNVKFSLEELAEVEDPLDVEDDELAFEKKLDLAQDYYDAINKLAEDNNNIQEGLNEQRTAKDAADMQKRLKDEADFKAEVRSQSLDLAEQTANALVDVSSRRFEREKTLELANLDARLQQGLISQADFEKEREAIERKAFQRQKRLELAQIAISLAREIASINANAAANPANAVTFGAAGLSQASVLTGLAVARSAVQAGIIASQSFAEGGYTGSGFGSADSSGFKQAGVVHEGEYVVPKNVLESQRGSSLVGALEAMRTSRPQPFSNIGFANGGFAGASGVDMSELENRITRAVASSIGSIQVVNNATDTITQAAKVNNIQSEATFG